MGISVDRIQGLSGSLAVKAPARTATDANITLSGLQTIASIALAEGDRVLVRAQTDPRQNGVYTASTGLWQRAKDFNGNNDVLLGTIVSVVEGDFGPNLYRTVIDTSSVVFGTTEFTFEVYQPATDPEQVAPLYVRFESAAGGETSVSLGETYNGGQLSMLVFRNGLKQETEDFTFTTGGSSVGFSEALVAGEVVEILAYKAIVGLEGPAGPSAYDVAVSNGFVGTEAQWLTSLEGEDGVDGSGVPAGGEAGQLLMKSSATDGDVEWLGDVSAFPVDGDLNDVDQTGWFAVADPAAVNGPAAGAGVCHTAVRNDLSKAQFYYTLSLSSSAPLEYWYRVKAGASWSFWTRVYTAETLDEYLDALDTFGISTLENATTDGKSVLTAASFATIRTLLSLGTAALEADTKYAHRANNLSDLASATTARTNLGLVIGTDVQAYDADTAKTDVAQSFTALQTFLHLRETTYTLSGTTPALNPAANGAMQTWSLTANSAPTDSLSNGDSLKLRISDGTARTITWPSVVWIGGTAPTLATTGWTHVELWKEGGVLYGAHVGDTV